MILDQILLNKYQLHQTKNSLSFLKNKPTSKLCFAEVNESKISKIIDELPSKFSCGNDNISLKITKYLKNLISLPLTTIINQTLNTGIFPDTLKVAKVRPLYKKVIIDYFLITDRYHFFHLFPKSLEM